jgi:carboxypeptidase C (cathepsin A)
MEGATTEIGPVVLFQIKESCSSSKCDYTEQLSTNPYAWNNHANLVYTCDVMLQLLVLSIAWQVFVDQPRNVGYSFGYGSGIHSSVDAGLDFVVFINGFLELFPEFKDRKVYVAGESYGGHVST